jgi:hypothetical protein
MFIFFRFLYIFFFFQENKLLHCSTAGMSTPLKDQFCIPNSHDL